MLPNRAKWIVFCGEGEKDPVTFSRRSFADIAKSIVLSKAPYDIKERACQTLSYVAWRINRFHAQHLIEDIITSGIDPMLEDLLNDSVQTH